MKNRKIFFAFSTILILIGLGAMIYNHMQGEDILNFDIEFKGGTVLHLDLEQQFNIETDIRPLVEEFFGSAVIQEVPGTYEVIITTQETDQQSRQQFVEQLKVNFGLTNNIILAEDSVSPTISPEIQRNAVNAVLLGSFLMLIYIWIRFQDFKFGAAAVLALIHDVLIMIGVYAVFRIPLNNSFIAAILTIIGYSINDTIIVFDRIRENRKLISGHDEAIVTISIKQTLTRSINTSITTLIMVSSLYIFGTSSVREFAFPLVIGTISGTYSSIFIASPIWYELRKLTRNKNQKKNTKEPDPQNA
ncbi:MAG: protein-export membrane protein SecF [Epulopiscium sp. Nuni2H_MBin001]|nr:MAG: protein-export membrane protein SecF [Epulopiscium sp. Nuni2H_MBin001]